MEETSSEALSCRLSPSEALRLDGAMYSIELLVVTHRVTTNLLTVTHGVTNLV